MKILAFQGYRYSDRIADRGRLAAPPFDQIDDELRDRLHAQSEHQFARLTRPVAEGLAGYQASRSTHDDWIRHGFVTREQLPAIYPYSIESSDGRVRLGLACLVGVGPSSEGDLRPHEETVDKPLADRLALLETTRVDLEPVLYIAEDDGTLEQMLTTDSAGEVLVDHVDPWNGDRHRLYRVSDPDRIGAYRRCLAARSAIIADGHHRTKVAQLFARKHRAIEGTAPAAKLAVLTSVASESLQIDPIHRAICVHIDGAAVAAKARSRTEVACSSGAELAAAVAAAEQPALGVWFAGTSQAAASPQIWALDPTDVPPGTPGAKAGLPVVLLHYQLLAAAGFTAENARDGSIQYRANPDQVYRMVERGEAKAGFWLPPMEPLAFSTATAGGDVLPPKSTRFLPKLVSGLVWSGHDAAVL